MTAATPDASSPRYSAPTPPTGGDAPDRQPAASARPDRPAERAPWYRRVWVLPVAAVLLVLLAFGSGFVAGGAAMAFRGLLGGPGSALVGPAQGHDGHRPGGFQSGDRDRDGDGPGMRPGGIMSPDAR